MSKNLTRKGLAFGAVVALGTTLFAGAPAQAASVLFAPTTGTGNTLVAGETFSLTASLSSDLPAANASQLKFKVANTTGVAATVTINSKTLFATATSAAHLAGASVVALDASVGGETAASALSASTTSAVYGIGSDVAAATSAIAATASAASNPTSIQIASTAATTASYTVTAFLDANNNAVIDNGELSAAQTVNFVKVADSGVTVALTKPVQSSTALAATVTFGADVNVAQLTANKYKVGFGIYGVSGAVSATNGSGAIASYLTAVSKNSGNTALTSAGTASAAPTAGATYNAQVYFDNAATTYAAIGTASTQVVAASTDADAMPLVVAPTVSDNIAVTTASSATYPTTAVNGVYKVRTAVTSTSVSATIKKTPTGVTLSGTSGVAVGAGVAVDVYVTAANEATPSGGVADTLTVAGVKVVTSGATANVSSSTKIATVTTDANGKVTVPVLSSLGTAADSVTIVLKVPNAASTATGQVQLVWTAATLVAPKYIYAGDSTPTVVKGGAVSLKYALTDSYGALVTGSSYELLFTAPGINGTTNATPVNVYAPFVNGIATVSFTDNSLAAGTNAAKYKVLKNVNGAWVEPANSAPDAALYTANQLNTATGVAASINVIAAAQTAAAVSGSAANSDASANASGAKAALDIAGVYVSGDPRSNANGFTAPAPTATSVVTVTGSVTDASGVGIAGAQVTLSLKGAQFASAAFADANAVYATDSITVNAGTTGSYTVYVATHTAGTNSLVITSGSATKTVSIYVSAPATTAGATLEITAVSKTVAGRTLTFTGKLTDKYGNAVATAVTANNATPDFKVEYSGPGFAAQTLPIDIDATGTFTVSVVTGSADSGVAVLKATYGGSKGAYDSTVTGSTADIVASKSVLVGVSASVSAGKKLATTVVKNAAGLTVKVVSGSKSVTKVATSDSFKVSLTKLTAGKKTVKVYVNDVLVTSKSVTVKK